MATKITYFLAIIVAVISVGAFFIKSYYFPNLKSMIKLALFQGKDNREEKALQYVKTHAKRGDPQDVLRAIDKFGWTVEWLMNVGDDKGEVLTAEVLKKKPKNALEIGAFVGYSAVRIGSMLPPDGHLTSVELSSTNAAIARQMVEYAGFTIIEVK